MRFFDRDEELKGLDRIWNAVDKGKFNIVIITGRRGVGKTRLVKEFARRNNIRLAYIFVKKKPIEQQIDNIISRIEEAVGVKLPRIKGIEDLFISLKHIVSERPVCIVFDEFQNFSANNNEIFAEFQSVFDDLKMHEGKVKILVIIIGSIIGMLREIFESQESPLYGRKTAEIFLKPFKYWMVRMMLEELGVTDEEDLIKIYSILGGMPRYYDTIDRLNFSFTVDDILEYLTSSTILAWKTVYGELIEEFKGAYMTYFQILEAIAKGKNTPEEISNYTGISVNSLSKYLNELNNYFDIIVRRYPITESPRSKRGRYFVKDPFYAFWFRFILPNIDYLEIGEPEIVKQMIKNELHNYTSKIFEDIVRETLLASAGSNFDGLEIPTMNKIGAWWDRRGNEIDIVGMQGKKIVLVGEIKFTQNPIGAKEIVKFSEKLELLKSKDYLKIFVSWNGFKSSAKSVLEELEITPIESNDLVAMWNSLSKIKTRK